MRNPALIFVFAVTLIGAQCASLSPHMVGGSEHDPSTGNHYAVMIVIRNGTQDSDFAKFCKGVEVPYGFLLPNNLAKTIVITSAECFQNPDQYRLAHVSVMDERGEFGKQTFGTLRFTVHPKFDPIAKVHNIAIVNSGRLRNPNELIQLPPSNDKFEGKEMEIATWSSANGDNFIYDHSVKTMNTTVVSSAWCKLFYPFSPIRNTAVCASGRFFEGLTKGDEGAILTYRGKWDLPILAGIAMFVRPWTNVLSLPTEFASIQQYTKWIRSKSPGLFA